MTSIYSIIGRNLRLFRERAGIAQTELAQACGMTKASISQIENGRQRISIDGLYRAAAALHCKVFDLLPPDLETDVDLRTTQVLDGPSISRVLEEIDNEIRTMNKNG